MRRSGQWKLASGSTRQNPDSPKPFSPQLFDLQADIGETTDVAARHPDVVKRLLALAESARADLGDGSKAGKNQRPAGFVENAKALTDTE